MDSTLAFTGKDRWAINNSRCKLDDQDLISNTLKREIFKNNILFMGLTINVFMTLRF